MMFIYDNNFLLENEILEIENIFYSNENKWNYSRYALQNDHENHDWIISLDQEDFQYFGLSVEKDSSHYFFIENIIKKFLEKHNMELTDIYRIRLNATPSVNKFIETRPHVDAPDKHYIFLYYVNDSDGDTVIFEETYIAGQKVKTTTPMHKITPKRGAAILVNGENFHTHAAPQNGDLRKVINANIMIKLDRKSEAEK